MKKINNYLWYIFCMSGIASAFSLFMIIAGGGVLADLEAALVEIEDLEKKISYKTHQILYLQLQKER